MQPAPTELVSPPVSSSGGERAVLSSPPAAFVPFVPRLRPCTPPAGANPSSTGSGRGGANYTPSSPTDSLHTHLLVSPEFSRRSTWKDSSGDGGAALPTTSAPSAPLCYDVRDPAIFWLNGRPFRLHKTIGRGGFGQVCQVGSAGKTIRAGICQVQVDLKNSDLSPTRVKRTTKHHLRG